MSHATADFEIEDFDSVSIEKEKCFLRYPRSLKCSM